MPSFSDKLPSPRFFNNQPPENATQEYDSEQAKTRYKKQRLANEIQFVDELLKETDAFLSRPPPRASLWCQAQGFGSRGLGISRDQVFEHYAKHLAGKFNPGDAKAGLAALWAAGTDPRIVFFCVYAKIIYSAHFPPQISPRERIRHALEQIWDGKGHTTPVLLAKEKAQKFYSVFLPNLLMEQEAETKFTNGVDMRPQPLLGNTLVGYLQRGLPFETTLLMHCSQSYAVEFDGKIFNLSMKKDRETSCGSWNLSFRYLDQPPLFDEETFLSTNELPEYTTSRMQMACRKPTPNAVNPYLGELINPSTFPGVKYKLKSAEKEEEQKRLFATMVETYQHLARAMNCNSLSNTLLHEFIKSYCYAIFLGPKMEDDQAWAGLPLREAAVFFPRPWLVDFFFAMIMGSRFPMQQLESTKKKLELLKQAK